MNAEAVNGMDLEHSTLALLAEFLAGYFDGEAHDVGAVRDTVFPKAVLRFQEAALPALTEAALGISVVWLKEGRPRLRWTAVNQAGVPTRQQEATVECGWMFLVRASGTTAAGTAQQAVEQGAGRLFWLLQNSLATLPLAQKGIHHLRPNPPRPAMSRDGVETDYRLRVLTCTGQVRYLMLSNDQES